MSQPYNSIHDVISDYLQEILTEALIINAPEAELAVEDVEYGNLQANPAKKRISVRIHLRDPDQLTDTEPHWADVPASATDEWSMYPDGEVGASGNPFWARRLCIEIQVFLTRTKENRLGARAIGAYVTKSAQEAIKNSGCCAGDKRDDFNEVLLQLKSTRIQIVEGGGPPGDFNYRSKIYVSALTEQP